MKVLDKCETSFRYIDEKYTRAECGFFFAKSFVSDEIYVFDLIALPVPVPVKRASKDMCLLPFVPSIPNALKC